MGAVVGQFREPQLRAATATAATTPSVASTAFAARSKASLNFLIMGRFANRQLLALLFCGLFASRGRTQPTPEWKVLGDTTGAPLGCSAAMAVGTINLLIAGLNDADSVKLARALAPAFVFSVIPTEPAHPFFASHSVSTVVAYARGRHSKHERTELTAIKFNGWRGQELEFGPIYFLRTADDVSIEAARGGGKGTYKCPEGLHIFNLGRLAPGDSGLP